MPAHTKFIVPSKIMIIAVLISVVGVAYVAMSGLGLIGDSSCRETRYEHFDSTGEVDWDRSKTRNCSPDTQFISDNFVTRNGNVYWQLRSIDGGPACISGTGDTVGLIYNLSLRCIFSEPGEWYSREERTLWLLGPHTPDFQVYSDTKTVLPQWQKVQQHAYATDSTSVYYKRRKLKDADPHQFSVYFPFGQDEKWHRFSFSKSGATTYLAGRRIPDIDPAQLTLLEPTQKPGHGLKQTWEYPLDCGGDFWGCRGLLGYAGKDVVYLQWEGATVFKDMATDDMFMFMTSKRIYFYSKGKFYEVVPDGRNTSATLVDMDRETYEKEP